MEKMSRQNQWFFLTDNKHMKIAKKFQEPNQFDADILLKHLVDYSYAASELRDATQDVKDVYSIIFKNDNSVMKLVSKIYNSFHLQNDQDKKVRALIKLYKD